MNVTYTNECKDTLKMCKSLGLPHVFLIIDKELNVAIAVKATGELAEQVVSELNMSCGRDNYIYDFIDLK